jgi:hypothetical protein
VNGLWPRTAYDEGVNVLESTEARIGTAVSVLDRARRPGKGRVGTIVQTYGHPEYLAVDVLLNDGSVELYWHYQLQATEK